MHLAVSYVYRRRMRETIKSVLIRVRAPYQGELEIHRHSTSTCMLKVLFCWLYSSFHLQSFVRYLLFSSTRQPLFSGEVRGLAPMQSACKQSAWNTSTFDAKVKRVLHRIRIGFANLTHLPDCHVSGTGCGLQGELSSNMRARQHALIFNFCCCVVDCFRLQAMCGEWAEFGQGFVRDYLIPKFDELFLAAQKEGSFFLKKPALTGWVCCMLGIVVGSSLHVVLSMVETCTFALLEVDSQQAPVPTVHEYIDSLPVCVLDSVTRLQWVNIVRVRVCVGGDIRSIGSQGRATRFSIRINKSRHSHSQSVKRKLTHQQDRSTNLFRTSTRCFGPGMWKVTRLQCRQFLRELL